MLKPTCAIAERGQGYFPNFKNARSQRTYQLNVKGEVLLRSTREKEIRNRAYEIYPQRGGQPGYELEDGVQAERELTK